MQNRRLLARARTVQGREIGPRQDEGSQVLYPAQFSRRVRQSRRRLHRQNAVEGTGPAYDRRRRREIPEHQRRRNRHGNLVRSNWRRTDDEEITFTDLWAAARFSSGGPLFPSRYETPMPIRFNVQMLNERSIERSGSLISGFLA